MDSYLKVTITKNFGNGNLVEIELTSGHQIKVSDSGIAEFDAAVTKINGMFDYYTAEYLPKLRFNAEAGQTVILDALRIDVTIDKGKRYVKVSTPQYSEFGIVWWPEDMKAANLDHKTFPPIEGYQCKEGSKVEVLMVNGKPKKVIKIIAPKPT